MQCRPPEPDRLHQVEELGRNQQPVEQRIAHTAGTEEPLEVPDGQGDIEGDEKPEPPLHRAPFGGLAPVGGFKPRVIGLHKKRREGR